MAKTNGQPSPELQKQFCEVPNELEELRDELIRLRAEAEGIACANPRVVQAHAILD